jgi:hypothetical protein
MRFSYCRRAAMAMVLQHLRDRKDAAMNRLLGLAMTAGMFAGAMLTSADEAISITVRPAVTSYRGSAQVKVLVARDEKNRLLTWEVDGPNYYRSSSQELDGASAPRTYLFTMRELPAGEFEVRATVKRNDRTAAMDRMTIRVVGGPG